MQFAFFEELDSIIIEGGRRSGKSNHMVYLMNLAYSMGYEIITNMELQIPHTKLTNIDIKLFMNQLKEIMKERRNNKDFHNTFLGIDEMQIIVPSQKWKSCADDAGVWAQIGKVGFTTCATAPQRDMIYNGYRDSCNKIITCKKKLRTQTEFKYIAIYQRQSDKIHDVYHTYAKVGMDGKKIFNLYDTHEVMYI